MKKLLVVFLVLAFVAPAMAADNLSIKGAARVRTWDFENYSDFNDDGDDKTEFVDQRVRVGLTMKANDNVSASLELDFAEDEWGSTTWATHRYTNEDALEVNRAYFDIKTGPVAIRAGQQFMSVGQSQVLRNNKPGLQVTIMTPVVVEIGYSVEQDSDLGAAADEQNLHFSVGYKSDVFSVEGFYAQQETSTASGTTDIEDIRNVFGVNGKFTVGPVKINTELALFGGDNGQIGGAKVDYVGTQFNVDADMKLSDMISIGADLIYSNGTTDANETKIAYVGDVYGRLNRSEGGSGNNIWGGDMAPIGGDDVFDPFNDNLGAIGIGVDCTIKPVAGLAILAHVLYLTPAEDVSITDATYNADDWDSAMVYNLGVMYDLAPKANIAVYYNLVDRDVVGANVADDNASGIFGELKISF